MTKIFQDNLQNLPQILQILRSGGVIALPTETVYGLAGVASSSKAMAKIYKAKGRPAKNPLIVHAGDMASLEKIVEFNETAYKLAQHFWPGPLTLVLPQKPFAAIAPEVSAGLPTLAVRIPAHPVFLTILKLLGEPLAAPSANASGLPSPTCAAHVQHSLMGRIDGIVDGGACSVGLESTIIDLSTGQPTILRLGGLPQEAIEEIIGPLAKYSGSDTAPKAPGMMFRHYAPKTFLRLNAIHVQPDEALLAFGTPLTGSEHVFSLSPTADLNEAAKNLYDGLYKLDEMALNQGLKSIAVMPIPMVGLGLTLNDRLHKAADGSISLS